MEFRGVWSGFTSAKFCRGKGRFAAVSILSSDQNLGHLNDSTTCVQAQPSFDIKAPADGFLRSVRGVGFGLRLGIRA